MRWTLAVILALVLCLTGCAPTAPAEPALALSADLYQPRSDIAKGRIAVSVTNGSERTVTITGVRLVSADYPGDPAWDGRPVDLEPGKGSPDLRIALPDAVCGEQAASAVVEVDWRDAASSGTQTITPGDRFSFLPAAHATACFTAAVDEVATIESADFEGGGPGTPADLVVAIGAGSGDGSFTIDSVEGTTLLAPWDGTGGAPTVMISRVVRGTDAASELRVPFVPNRCDAHALAEDKVGTLIPFAVTTADGQTGTVRLTASDDLRRKMYDFYAAFCGL